MTDNNSQIEQIITSVLVSPGVEETSRPSSASISSSEGRPTRTRSTSSSSEPSSSSRSSSSERGRDRETRTRSNAESTSSASTDDSTATITATISSTSSESTATITSSSSSDTKTQSSPSISSTATISLSPSSTTVLSSTISSSTSAIGQSPSSQASSSSSGPASMSAAIAVGTVLGAAAFLTLLWIVFRHFKPIRSRWDAWKDRRKEARTYRETLAGMTSPSGSGESGGKPMSKDRRSYLARTVYWTGETAEPQMETRAGLGLGRVSMLRERAFAAETEQVPARPWVPPSHIGRAIS